MNKLTLCLALALSLVFAGQAQAQVFNDDDDFNWGGSDEGSSGGFDGSVGLFGRFTLGLAYSLTTLGDGPQEIEFDGIGGSASLLLGVSLGRTAFHASFIGQSVFEPDITFQGEDLGDLDDTSFNYSAFGAGVTHYTPSRFYFGGSLYATDLSIEFEDDNFSSEIETDVGFGVTANVGKEWGISDNLGIGVGGEIFYSVIPASDLDDDFDDDFTLFGFGISASITYL